MAEEHNQSCTGRHNTGFAGRGCSSTERVEGGTAVGLVRQLIAVELCSVTNAALPEWRTAGVNL